MYKIQRCWHYVYHNSEKSQARVRRLFTVRAMHAYKHMIPSCAIHEDLVPMARIGVYLARRCSIHSTSWQDTQ
jgi:hypothetical protein